MSEARHEHSATDHDEQAAKVAAIVESSRIALLTTVAEGGKLVSRPLAALHRDFDGELWFFTADPSHKTDQVAAHEQVNVAFSSDAGWVSISGTATVSHDQAKIDEFWSSHAEAWFDGGRDDPSVALLRVEAASAEYWSIEDPRLVTAVKYAKARLTGERPDLGENASLEL